MRKLRSLYLKTHPHCFVCWRGTKVQVHHVKPFHRYPKLELEYEPDEVDPIIKKFLETVNERVKSNDNTKEIPTKLKQKPKIQGSMPKGWSPENDSKKLDYSEEYSEALFELVKLFDKRKYYLLKLLFNNKIRDK